MRNAPIPLFRKSITPVETIDEESMRYAESLASLLRIQTVRASDTPATSSDRDDDWDTIYAFRDALRAMFPNVYSTCDYEDFGSAILLRWPGKDPKAEPILFMNHHDVVGPNGDWTDHDAFSGDISDGRVWGRGALDTKGGLYCMLQAAEELISNGFEPACDIYFESSCDEESFSHGCDEVSRVLEERGIHLRVVLDEGGYIVHDPLGGADGDFAMVGVGEKSIVTLKFTAKGNGGHASIPGKNTPLVVLAKFIAAAEKKMEAGSLFTVELSPTVAEMLRRMAPTVKNPLGKAFEQPEKVRSILEKVMPSVSSNAAAIMRTTAAFTMAHGSDEFNVLPSEAWVVANLRCSHHQGQEESIKAITKLAKRFDLETEVVERSIESPVSDFNAPEFKTLERCIKRQFPDVIVSPYIMAGASDARFMSRVCDTCFRFIPMKIDDQQFGSIHGIDENVSISMLAPAITVYKDLMQEYAQ